MSNTNSLYILIMVRGPIRYGTWYSAAILRCIYYAEGFALQCFSLYVVAIGCTVAYLFVIADLCYNCIALEDKKEVLLVETLSLQQLVEKLLLQKFEECVTKLKSTAAALNWKPIGVHLGMDLTECDEIEQGAGGNTEEAFQQMMMKWRTKKATYAALIKTLEKEKLNTGVPIVMEYQEQEQEYPRQDSPPAPVSGLSDVQYISISDSEYE